MTSHDEQRQTFTGPDGRPVLTYLPGTRDGHPWADLAEVVGPDPVPAILAGMSGWAVSGSVELGQELIRHGARVMRHAHGMRRELVADPLPQEWATAGLPEGPEGGPVDGLRIVPCDRPARDLFPAWRAAFSAGHPDHFTGGDEEALETQLVPLLSGDMLGPVLPCSALVVDAEDRVVAGVVVADRDGLPWIATVFRLPEAGRAGLGSVLLRRMLADAASHGLTEIGLAVSDGNPARHLYEKLGFTVTDTSLTVLVP
ncbi:GNAT family N-acetyltransferase [Streptomyces sp. NPDC004327]|uniref:GNAT family N-acetyltransferase n=1 Tax=unclassified Streptomyces TaxID=2593676 RepID=UPI0036C162B5